MPESSTLFGSTTFPLDLLIFSPSPSITKPCATTLLYSGTPADMSMQGQITQWNHVMSLPMTCASAGQNRDTSPPPAVGDTHAAGSMPCTEVTPLA